MEKELKQCSKCEEIYENKNGVCPYCGFDESDD